jgi:hypothetical protein
MRPGSLQPNNKLVQLTRRDVTNYTHTHMHTTNDTLLRRPITRTMSSIDQFGLVQGRKGGSRAQGHRRPAAS